MNIKPLSNWIHVKPISDDTADNVEGARIYIPENLKPPPECGVVLGVGPKVEFCQIGNRVSFSRYRLTEAQLEGEKVFMVREGDVIGVIP